MLFSSSQYLKLTQVSFLCFKYKESARGEVKKSSYQSKASWPWDAQIVSFQLEAVALVRNGSSQN